MTNDLHELHVLQEDMGSGAVTYEDHETGVTYLFISPDQSFDYAVKSVQKACPTLSLSQVQEIIRTHCPDIREMNERLGVDHPPVPRFEAAPPPEIPPAVDKGAHRRPRPPRWARVAAIAAPALVGGTLIAQLFTPGRSDSGTPDAAGVTVTQSEAPSVFDDPTFKEYAASGDLRCEPVGQYAAKCVDEDGQVMLSEASVGDSAVFTFSYNAEKIGFRLFETPSDASLWAAEEGNMELYDNLTVVDRVVLWGTDKKRLREWAADLAEVKSAHTMGGAAPLLAGSTKSPIAALPQRLAVLALGTLGMPGAPAVDPVQARSLQQVQTLRAVELIMGVTDGATDGMVSSGPSDAVAIAADAMRPPAGGLSPASGPATPLPAEPTPVKTTPPATAPQPATSPAPAEPTKQPQQTTPPAPAAGEQQPATSPAPAEPTKQPEQTTPPVVSTGEPAQDPQPASPPDPAPPAATTPEPSTPAVPAPEPAAEDQVDEEPAQEHEEPADQAEAAHDATGPDTAPAPPAEEEPEEGGLSLDVLPTAWAA
ncbi:hypothetical protein AB0G49_14105 [Streptomyces longwoodensis]|uniref:hypothetical protein n=1 Tax=Streptomyces longwoodensis TaxID=68231 RepID=UPI0034085FE8